MKITFDKYSQKYWIKAEQLITTMTFEELEAFQERLHQIVQDEYSKGLEDFLDDGDCDGCKI